MEREREEGWHEIRGDSREGSDRDLILVYGCYSCSFDWIDTLFYIRVGSRKGNPLNRLRI